MSAPDRDRYLRAQRTERLFAWLVLAGFGLAGWAVAVFMIALVFRLVTR